ncbi:MAG: reverse transcriptase [Thermodesulfobacteriota bacterium]|nr:reverse transcriptase [Thermodesulfobacteriota bacterium]
MQTSLQRTANKARRNKRHRFRNLYTILNGRFLIESWFRLNRKAASGVDRITAKEYSSNLQLNIRDLFNNLKKKRYNAKLVRRTYIPKGNDQLRPLGIPSTQDKLLQKGVTRILNANFEQDFLPVSFGCRLNLGEIDAIQVFKLISLVGEFCLYSGYRY